MKNIIKSQAICSIIACIISWLLMSRSIDTIKIWLFDYGIIACIISIVINALFIYLQNKYTNIQQIIYKLIVIGIYLILPNIYCFLINGKGISDYIFIYIISAPSVIAGIVGYFLTNKKVVLLKGD